MKRIRVYEIAKVLGLTNKVVVEGLQELGIKVKNHYNAVTENDLKKFLNQQNISLESFLNELCERNTINHDTNIESTDVFADRIHKAVLEYLNQIASLDQGSIHSNKCSFSQIIHTCSNDFLLMQLVFSVVKYLRTKKYKGHYLNYLVFTQKKLIGWLVKVFRNYSKSEEDNSMGTYFLNSDTFHKDYNWSTHHYANYNKSGRDLFCLDPA